MDKVTRLIKVMSILWLSWTIIRVPVMATELTEESTAEKLRLRAVLVKNSTVFREADWKEIIAPYLNQEVDFPTLLELQRQLSELYRTAGYPTSSFVLLAQDIKNGTVTYEAIEGKLVVIEIEGLSYIQDNYIRSRLEAAARPPLSLTQLQSALVLLQQSPLIETIEAEFDAGVIQGESELLVRIVEAPRWYLGIRADNAENPQIGAVGMGVYGSNLNLWGWGDRLDFEYKLTQKRGLERLFASYTIPVNALDTIVRLYYRDDETRIVEAPLEDVGLVTESSTVSVGVTQPLLKKPNQELNLEMSLDLRQSETFIFETVPFPVFNDSNRINLSVLRLSSSFLTRTPETSFGLRAQLSFGLNGLGASKSGDFLDTDFFSGQLQAQSGFKLSENWLVLTRFQAQVTPDSLPSMEQFAIGGVETVRGYRRNIRSGDLGVALSLELPYTLFRSEKWGNISVSPFFDWGTTWNNTLPTVYPNSLASTGISLDWVLFPTFSLQVDYGVSLIDVPTLSTDTLNDAGLNFQLQFGTTF